MNDDIRARLDEALNPSQCELLIDGNRAQLHIVSAAFEGLNRVKRQQAVYACLNDYISDGRLHAVTITAVAQSEFDAGSGE